MSLGWRMILFDDENFSNLLGYQSLRSAGLASSKTTAIVRIGDPRRIVWLSREAGYNLDILGVRYVEDAFKAITGISGDFESTSDAAGIECLRAAEFKFDFAFLDWKDKSVYETAKGQLMGYLLGLEARKRNPRCSIVLMSAFKTEADALYETHWVRNILGEAKDGTRDLSTDDARDSKLSALFDPFVLEQERQKAVELILGYPALRLAVLDRLGELPDLVRWVPLETVRASVPEDGDVVEGPDNLSDEIEENIRLKLDLPLGPGGTERLPWLFPFSFGRIFQEVRSQKNRLVDWHRGHPLVLDNLREFAKTVLPPLLAGSDAVGRTIVEQVAPSSVHYQAGQVEGLHLLVEGGDDAGNLARLKTLAEGYRRKVDELRTAYKQQIPSTDRIFEVMETFDATVRTLYDNVCAKTTDCGAARDVIEQLSHETFRIYPITMIEKSTCRWAVETATGWHRRREFNFVSGLGTHNEVGKGLWFYGVAADAEQAVRELVGSINSDAAVISGVSEWLSSPPAVLFCLRIDLEEPCGIAQLESMSGGTGNLTRALERVARYFSVGVGNEHALVAYPPTASTSYFPDGLRTVFELSFVVPWRQNRGGVGTFRPH